MSRLGSRIMYPAVAFMRRFSVSHKMLWMGLAVFLPLVALLANLVRAELADLAYVDREIEGTDVVIQLQVVASLVQSHRGLTNRVLSGDDGAQPRRAAIAAQLNEAIAELDNTIAELSGFDMQDVWQPVRQQISTLAAGQHDPDRVRAFAQHSAQVAAVRSLLLLTGERSGLLLDPEADTYFMMDLLLDRTLPWTESVGVARGLGAGMLARGAVTAQERADVLTLPGAIERSLDDARSRTAAMARAGAAIPASFEQAAQASEAYVRRIADLFTNVEMQASPAEYFDAGTATIAAVSAFRDDVGRALQQALVQRKKDHSLALALQLGLTLSGVAMLLYLSAGFALGVIGALRALNKGVNEVANGNLAHSFAIQGRDEFADMGRVVERMADNLSAMVAEIRSSAVMVSGTGQNLAQGSEALAQRTEEQAGSLQQFVVTVGQLSQQVADSSTKIQGMDQLTGDLRTRAEEGGKAMNDTVQSLQSLQASSSRVSEIVSVIDGIAFQTNILALNAAVEAARAGEAGRGFAVVATEVRQLAQRSGEAAKEIRSLIARSQEQVQGTAARVQGTSEVLTSLIDGVREVSTSLRAISEASASQSKGLVEMAGSVGNLDEITRQNAGMVEQSSLSSQDLVGRAKDLAGAVGSIRLRQGSADEALALVDRAMALIRAQGLATARSSLQSAREGFVDRDLYVWVINTNGQYVVHGAKPDFEGHRVHELPGIDGDRFVREIFAASDGDWVDYDIINPASGQVMPKTSVVRRLDDELVVGCGIYKRKKVAAEQPA